MSVLHPFPRPGRDHSCLVAAWIVYPSGCSEGCGKPFSLLSLPSQCSVPVFSPSALGPCVCATLCPQGQAPSLQRMGLPGTRAGPGPQLSVPPQQHSNASQSLCDIIRLSREQVIQVQDSPEPDQLLATLEKCVCGWHPGHSGGGEPAWGALLPDACPRPPPGRRRLSSS